MSQILHEAMNAANAGIDDHIRDQLYRPQPAPTQASPGFPDFVDGSGPIFSMYLEMAEEEDKKMTESWKADADGILIFTGLFSAAVASFISVSIQDIRPNPQDTSNFYLANIYQASIAGPNSSDISIPSSPPTFSPPTYAVWVNALWFMSLVISLTCAMLATLLQQWARRYLKITQPRYSPHKRARIRAFFLEGVDKFYLPWVVEALPTLLHVSLFLFFAGLVVFLCNVNLTIFKLVLSWVCFCAALYGCITFLPIFFRDCPYYTPLSLPAWNIGVGAYVIGVGVLVGIPYVTLRTIPRLTLFLRRLFLSDNSHASYGFYRVFDPFVDLWVIFRKQLVWSMQKTNWKTAQETALNSPSEINARAIMWTLDSLDEDHELERFFSGLPGFRNSKVVEDPLPSLNEEQKEKLSTTLMGLLDRTSSSDLLPESIKSQRVIICARAFPQADILNVSRWILRNIDHPQYEGLRTAEIGRIARGWADSLRGDEYIAAHALAIVASIIALAQRHNNSWFIFASEELGVPESVLRNHATHGDSLSLAILIHITRQQFSHFRKEYWLPSQFSFVLEAVSKFNAQDTSRELQHEFCALWNKIVRKVQNDNDRWMARETLGPIRNIYITLHQDTDSAPTQFSASTSDNRILSDPSAYPLCNVAGHHSDSTHHNHNDSASAALAHVIPHHSNALVIASPANSDAHSSSISVVESLASVPSLDNPHPPHRTTSKGLLVPASLDPAAVGAMPRLTPETSTSTPPLSPISPPAITPQHSGDFLTLNLPSSDPVLDNPLPQNLFAR